MTSTAQGRAARKDLVGERLRRARQRRQEQAGQGAHPGGSNAAARGTRGRLEHREGLEPALSSAQRRLW